MNDIFTHTEKNKILNLKDAAKSRLEVLFEKDSFVMLHLVVAGGAFVSWFYNQTPKDIDVFVLNDVNTQRLVREQLELRGFKSKDMEYMKQTNDGAKHVQEVWEGTFMGAVYQFIFTDCKTREELLADFDFKHCTVSYLKDKLYITRNTYDAIANKHLIIHNDKVQVQWRKEKFLKRGWIIPETKTDNKSRFVNFVRDRYGSINMLDRDSFQPIIQSYEELYEN